MQIESYGQSTRVMTSEVDYLAPLDFISEDGIIPNPLA